jgi:hypothetical protein
VVAGKDSIFCGGQRELSDSEIATQCLQDKYVCWREGKVLGIELGNALGRELCYEQRNEAKMDLYCARRSVDIDAESATLGRYFMLILEEIYKVEIFI